MKISRRHKKTGAPSPKTIKAGSRQAPRDKLVVVDERHRLAALETAKGMYRFCGTWTESEKGIALAMIYGSDGW